MKTFVLYFYIFFKAIHPTVKTVGFLAIFFVIRRRHRDEISWIFVFDCVKRCLVKGLKIFRIVKSIQKGSRVRQIPETVSPGSCFLDAISFPDASAEATRRWSEKIPLKRRYRTPVSFFRRRSICWTFGRRMSPAEPTVARFFYVWWSGYLWEALLCRRMDNASS